MGHAKNYGFDGHPLRPAGSGMTPKNAVRLLLTRFCLWERPLARRLRSGGAERRRIVFTDQSAPT